MPTPLPTGAVIQVTILGTDGDANRRINVLHYQFTSSTGFPDYKDWLDTVLWPHLSQVNGILDQMKRSMCNACSIEQVWMQPVTPVRRLKLIKQYGQVGVVNLPQGPPNVAVTFTKYTESAARWGLGSFHFGGLCQNINNAGRVNDLGYGVQLDALANSLKQAVFLGASLVAVPVLYSGDEPQRVTEVIDVQWQKTIRVMRRRTLGVGI